VTALGGYALTAITALTVQDTQSVYAVHPVPLDFLRQQIVHALVDPGADAIKTGMLGDASVINLVCDLLTDVSLPLVVDPVMVAKGGQSLLATTAVETLRRRLLPLCAILTPNVPEAEVLTGCAITGRPGMLEAAEAILDLGASAVLLKGGHLSGDVLLDLLAIGKERYFFEHPKQATRHTHGTGCTLSSAIATRLAQGLSLEKAVERSINYVQAAIASAPGFGIGHGPLNHLLSP
jgi:hydroxymethylpyrimidine/phosphomethylpyrimidine kinase